MGCVAVIVLNAQSAPLLATFAVLYNSCSAELCDESLKVQVLLLVGELNGEESSFDAAHNHFWFDMK